MTEILVGKAADFDEETWLIISAENIETGVLRVEKQFYAYQYFCLHQGDPACEGTLIGKVKPIFGEDRSVLSETFSETEKHFVCTWHGWECDLATGECASDRRLRLKLYDVVLRGDEIYVVT